MTNEAPHELWWLLQRLYNVAEAARDYYDGYCQDEAADDGPDFTGCSPEQHRAAAALRDALADYASDETMRAIQAALPAARDMGSRVAATVSPQTWERSPTPAPQGEVESLRLEPFTTHLRELVRDWRACPAGHDAPRVEIYAADLIGLLDQATPSGAESLRDALMPWAPEGRLSLPPGCWVNNDGWISLKGGPVIGALWANGEASVRAYNAEFAERIAALSAPQKAGVER